MLEFLPLVVGSLSAKSIDVFKKLLNEIKKFLRKRSSQNSQKNRCIEIPFITNY